MPRRGSAGACVVGSQRNSPCHCRNILILDLRGREPYELAMLFLILRTGGIQADERDIDVLADDFIVGA